MNKKIQCSKLVNTLEFKNAYQQVMLILNGIISYQNIIPFFRDFFSISKNREKLVNSLKDMIDSLNNVEISEFCILIYLLFFSSERNNVKVFKEEMIVFMNDFQLEFEESRTKKKLINNKNKKQNDETTTDKILGFIIKCIKNKGKKPDNKPTIMIIIRNFTLKIQCLTISLNTIYNTYNKIFEKSYFKKMFNSIMKNLDKNGQINMLKTIMLTNSNENEKIIKCNDSTLIFDIMEKIIHLPYNYPFIDEGQEEENIFQIDLNDIFPPLTKNNEEKSEEEKSEEEKSEEKKNRRKK